MTPSSEFNKSSEKLSGNVLFQALRLQASRMELVFPTQSTKTVNNLVLETYGKLAVELGATFDVVRLLGNGQFLTADKRISLSSDHLYAQIDVSGSGNKTVKLMSALPRLRRRYDLGDVLSSIEWDRVDSPAIIDGQFVRQVLFGASNSIIELDNPTPYQNPKNKFDSDLHGSIARRSSFNHMRLLNVSVGFTPTM